MNYLFFSVLINWLESEAAFFGKGLEVWMQG